MNNIQDIIKRYNDVLEVMDSDAHNHEDRAYGGFVRATKGKLQEWITESLIKIAWTESGGENSRLTINQKKIRIPIKDFYINRLSENLVKEHIIKNQDEYYYSLSVDKHIFIDNKLVSAIECKAYTENAMIKRILVDFSLLKTQFPDCSCYLFQLESQLGGDYSSLNDIIYGSKSTHSIMRYFDTVDCKIITLLQGERNIDSPIHKNFKPLTEKSLTKALSVLKNDLKQYV